MSTGISFKAYRRAAHSWGAFGAYHGHYDGLSTGPLTHAHLQILVPLKGRIHLGLAGGEGQLLGPERAIAILPATPHAASTLDGPFEFVAINAPAAWLASLAPAAPAGPGIVPLGHHGVWLQARQMALALDEPLPELSRFLAAGVEQLGAYLAQAIAAPRLPEHGDRTVLQAVETILARHAEPLSVAGLAAALAVSPRQLERRFLAAIGVSPRRFLIDVRLAAARERLATSDAPIERIGEQVGFINPSHFARAFKAACGLTPSAYRRARSGA